MGDKNNRVNFEGESGLLFKRIAGVVHGCRTFFSATVEIIRGPQEPLLSEYAHVGSLPMGSEATIIPLPVSQQNDTMPLFVA